MHSSVRPSLRFRIFDAGEWIDMAQLYSLVAVLDVDDGKFEQATSAAGAGVKDAPARAASDGTHHLLDLFASELDVNGGYRFVRLDASEGSGIVLAMDMRYGPPGVSAVATGAEGASASVGATADTGATAGPAGTGV